MAHFVCPQHKKTNLFSDKGSVTHDGCSYGNPPVSQLIPGKEVARVTKAERQDEKAYPKHPVELPRRPVGAGVKYPDHMQKGEHHHSVRSPSVQVPQDLAIEDKGKGLHIEVGSFGRRRVMEHEEDAGDRQDDEEKAGNSTETERVGKSYTMSFHLHRKDVKEKVMIHEH